MEEADMDAMRGLIVVVSSAIYNVADHPALLGFL